MNKKITEQNELIATRVPPGDRWKLLNDSRKVIHNSLTEALESYFMETKQKCEYRLAPMDSFMGLAFQDYNIEHGSTVGYLRTTQNAINRFQHTDIHTISKFVFVSFIKSISLLS